MKCAEQVRNVYVRVQMWKAVYCYIISTISTSSTGCPCIESFVQTNEVAVGHPFFLNFFHRPSSVVVIGLIYAEPIPEV